MGIKVPGEKNRFVGSKAPVKVKFMGEQIDIQKLTVAQVIDVQKLVKSFEESPSEMDNIKTIVHVIQLGAPELADLTEDEMYDFPIDELAKLSNEIMKHSGLVQPDTKK
jgi:hypothetical protein